MYHTTFSFMGQRSFQEVLKGSLKKFSILEGQSKLSQLGHLKLNFAAPESVWSLKHNKKTNATWQLSTYSAGIATTVQVKAKFLHVSLEE